MDKNTSTETTASSCGIPQCVADKIQAAIFDAAGTAARAAGYSDEQGRAYCAALVAGK